MNHRRGIACAVFAALLAGAIWTAPADAQGGRIKQKQGVKRGQTLEQITQTIQLPDSVNHWKPGNLTVPVRMAYQEITGTGGQ